MTVWVCQSKVKIKMSLTEVQSQNVKWKTEKPEEERLLSDYQGLRLLQKRERSGEMDTTYTEFTRPFLQLQPTKTEGVCAHASADPIFLGIHQPKTSVHSCSRWIWKYFSQSEYIHNKNADEDCRWTITESLSRLFYPSGPSKHEILIIAAHSWENLILRSSWWRILLARIDYIYDTLFYIWLSLANYFRRRRQQNSG